MRIAPHPANENERLEALRAYAILDTPPEQSFDDIVEAAAALADTPIALVSLVDRTRQWFKAKVGLDVCQTERDVAFCAHALLSPETFVVEDTLKDERFFDNPLVQFAPHIRFYAGVPLLEPRTGLPLGTLCVIDYVPRQLGAQKLSSLRALARLVVEQLEARRNLFCLGRSEAWLFAISNSSPLGILAVDQSCSPTFVNERFYRMVGRPPNPSLITAAAWHDGLHAEDREQILELFAGAMRERTPFALQCRWIRPDLSLVWASVHGDALVQAGQVVGCVSMWKDITERKAIERDIEETQERFLRLFEHSYDAHFIIDETGVVRECNDAAVRLLRTDGKSSVIGRRVDEWFPLRQPDGMLSADRARRMRYEAKAGLAHRFEFTVAAQDGTLIPIEATRMEVDIRGMPAVMSVWNDLTKRKEYEQELARARDSAEALARAKTDFLAMMSHEIRTPMHGVIGTTELLLDSPLDDAQKKHLQTIRSCGDALLVLIDDILDYSRGEAGKIALNVAPFEPRRLAEDVVSVFQASASAAGSTLGHQVAEDVPALLLGDGGRVRQVLLNLVGNAVKFTRRGDVRVEIAQEATPDEGVCMLRVVVSDTGIGMSEATLANLFQPFVQGDGSTTRRYGGSGLGLAICKQLLGVMQGHITVESELGRGSRFTILLPLEIPSVAQKSAHEEGGESGRFSIAPVSHEFRVLVAEDNLVNQKLLKAQLAKLKLHADLVSTGEEAIAAVLRAPYDVLLMDCQMPVMGGVEASLAIRALPSSKNLRIIALTANSTEQDRARCLAAGMDDYLAKPVKLAELRRALARWAGGWAHDENAIVQR